MRVLGVLSLGLAFALATWIVGWIAVPIVALAFGFTAARERVGLEAIAGVLLAWAGLLALQALRGSVSATASLLGSVIGIPSWTILLATLLFGVVLAWSAAVIGRELGRAVRRRRAGAAAPSHTRRAPLSRTPLSSAPP